MSGVHSPARSRQPWVSFVVPTVARYSSTKSANCPFPLPPLKERTVGRVGGTEPIPVDVRVIAATHRDLAQMVRNGDFRQDLYFRLNVVRLTIRPLRERREDIVPLAEQFLADVANIYGEPRKELSAA